MRIPGLWRSMAAIALATALAACADRVPLLPFELAPLSAPPAAKPWEDVARQPAIDSIANIDVAWADALGQARWARFGKAIAAEGALLDPRGGLSRPLPPPGRYQCRVIKLGFAPGARHVRGQGFAVFGQQFCYIEQEGELTTLVKETGAERHAGRLWPDADTRLVFLGTLARGGRPPSAYGDDPGSDLAGVFERIGEFRWRLVIPWPHLDSTLDVIELVPFTGPPA